MIQRLPKSLQLACILGSQWRRRTRKSRALWLQETALECAHLLELEIVIRGSLPMGGLVVANHLGYLDVIALASVLPCRFVAKSDVKKWPVFGTFATQGGSIFVNRSSRAAVAATGVAISHALAKRFCTVIFPEGTSSDGSGVLPFYPSLFEPAIASRSRVTPLGISYRMENGNPSRQMAYHGDATLVPHLWKLLGTRGMKIILTFGATRVLKGSRKTAAAELRKEVTELAGCGSPPRHSLSQTISREEKNHASLALGTH